MEPVFTDTGEDVWEPSLTIGELFVGGVDALGNRNLRVPTGLDDVSGDWVKVDPQLYGEFVTLTLQRRGRSTHWDMIQLMGGLGRVRRADPDRGRRPDAPGPVGRAVRFARAGRRRGRRRPCPAAAAPPPAPAGPRPTSRLRPGHPRRRRAVLRHVRVLRRTRWLQ
ncbi:DUF6086 family protein [Streptomyces sp. NPDC056653]|uniref:DUF6086 family protein n=1 Tax=Streptomyces sp. NPDC056653 TaxID=3345894 RepID=UPI003688C960